MATLSEVIPNSQALLAGNTVKLAANADYLELN